MCPTSWDFSRVRVCCPCSRCRLAIWQPHDKTHKMICAPSEDSDQSGNLPSLIRVLRSGSASAQSDQSLCCVIANQWEAKDQRFFHAYGKGSDQTGCMPRVIWVFAGLTGNFVGFVMGWFISSLSLVTDYPGKQVNMDWAIKPQYVNPISCHRLSWEAGQHGLGHKTSIPQSYLLSQTILGSWSTWTGP